MQIRAAAVRQVNQPFSVEVVDLDPPKEGEVLVRMAATGVCHSDWHLVTGATKHPLPVVPGHEGAGFVESVGPGVPKDLVGRLVALNWAPCCGKCEYCLRDRPALCKRYLEPIWQGTMLDGTTRLRGFYHFSALSCFADYAVVPEVCCVPMPDDLSPEVAAVIGCAVTTGVGSVLHTANVPVGASVIVFGCGGVGLSTILGARLAGASPITAVDISATRLNAALACGADRAVHNDGAAPIAPADYAFEAIGSPKVQEQAIASVKPGGTIVLSGIAPSDSAIPVKSAEVTRKELTIAGSYYGSSNPARDFPMLARLYASGRLPLDRLLGRRYPLDEINEAYADMLAGRVARGIISFGDIE